MLETRDVVEGSIRISLAGKFAEEHVLPLLAQFCVEHPRVELEADFSARNVDLIGEGFDLAVRMGPLANSSSLTATRLLSVPMFVLASPSLLERLPPIRTPADLLPQWCLHLVRRPWSFAKGQRREEVIPAGGWSSNSGAAVLQAALAGLGIVNVPAYYAHAALADGRLTRILEDWTAVEESVFYLVMPTSRYRPLRVQRLIEFLKERLNPVSAIKPCSKLPLAGGGRRRVRP